MIVAMQLAKSNFMITIKKSKNSQYYFLVKARNGKVLVTSETYKTRGGARKGIRALRFSAYSNVKDETKK